jgi:glycosyltransferase involved in cell wall biosynthesis
MELDSAPRGTAPTVSIVIPVFNGARYLGEAIDSALGQTYPHVEVIVVNDGSTDDGETARVAASYGNRIRYVEKENGGVATALNLGIREMRGQFFAWLSHDDVYYPEKVERQVAWLEALSDERAVVFANYDVIDAASHVCGTGAIDGFARDSSILSVVGTYVNGCSMLIPRRAFEATGLFNEALRNSQDNELWLRMALRGYRFTYMPEALIQSRKHPGQGSVVEGARHAGEARAFYRWALAAIGPEGRTANAVGLFRILIAKRVAWMVGPFFRMLREDRSLAFAASSLWRALWSVARSTVARRLPASARVRRLLDIGANRRFEGSSDYWERRYREGQTSGVGSYGRYARYKAEVLNGFVAAHGIRRVAEFGCGDGNQLSEFSFPAYLGLDVSQAAVERCRRLYQGDPTKRFLALNGPAAIEAVRQFNPELTLSLDVIYHLVEDAVFAEHIATLFAVSTRYVIVYSTNFDRRYDFRHQVDRKFTDHVARHVAGWRLREVVTNPYKGADTQSDFYVYEKTAAAAAAVAAGPPVVAR